MSKKAGTALSVMAMVFMGALASPLTVLAADAEETYQPAPVSYTHLVLLLFAVVAEFHDRWRLVNALTIFNYRNKELTEFVGSAKNLGLFPGVNRVEDHHSFFRIEFLICNCLLYTSFLRKKNLVGNFDIFLHGKKSFVRKDGVDQAVLTDGMETFSLKIIGYGRQMCIRDRKNINTCKACPERKGLEKMSAGTHPQNHPADDININENI